MHVIRLILCASKGFRGESNPIQIPVLQQQNVFGMSHARELKRKLQAHPIVVIYFYCK